MANRPLCTVSIRSCPILHSEGLVWISKSSGLPLQQETNTTSGAAPNHMRARHEYTNVKAPPIG